MTFDEENSLVEEKSDKSFYAWCVNNGRQDLLQEWDEKKNFDTDPKEVSFGTDIKVWWRKEYDDPNTGKHFVFSWLSAINKRVAGRGCPYLSNPPRAIMPGFNDLATTHPKLVEEWDFDRNLTEFGLKPSNVSKGSSAKVYWLCEKHGLYLAKVTERARGNGCPYCAGKQIKPGYNDLATVRPDIAKDWDVEKNGIGPESVTIGSIKKVWWRCQKGHSWQATPNERTSAHVGCPYCSGRRVLAGFNDLATVNPRIASEWNYERNGNLKPEQVTSKSNRIVWWVCPSGHEFKAQIGARTIYGTGCPACNKERKTSFSEKAVLYYVKLAFPNAEENVKFDWLGKRELDIYIPDSCVGIEYDGKHWHRNSLGDKEKDELCETHGVRLFRVREAGCPDYESPSTKLYFGQGLPIADLGRAIGELLEQLGITGIDVDIDRDYSQILERYISKPKETSLLMLRPDLAAEWDYEKNGKITPGYVQTFSNKKVWWKCPKCGMSYHMMVSSRTGEKHSNCPYCSKKKILKGLNDFGTEHPELLSEWDEERNVLSPYELPSGSRKKIWWKCSEGHSWEASLCSRTSLHTGCPYCAHQKTDGTNSFGTLYPDLLEEWDYNENDANPYELLPGSNKKFHWVCKKCGHHFAQSLSARVLGHKGCPLCAHQVLISGVNDLATQFPEVALEWNYERNALGPSEVSGGTNKKYWWRCKKCGHEWEASVASRTKRGSGCPVCAGKEVITGVNDLATMFPTLILEWDYEKNALDPTRIKSGSNQKAWWKCSKGHSWQSVIHTRTLGHCGCPFCANKLVAPGENDLLTLFPEVAAEWDYERNSIDPSHVLAGTNKKYWFKCQRCNHEWEASVSNRTLRHSGCPKCAAKKKK